MQIGTQLKVEADEARSRVKQFITWWTVNKDRIEEEFEQEADEDFLKLNRGRTTGFFWWKRLLTDKELVAERRQGGGPRRSSSRCNATRRWQAEQKQSLKQSLRLPTLRPCWSIAISGAMSCPTQPFRKFEIYFSRVP
jgi:hypothetical protein